MQPLLSPSKVSVLKGNPGPLGTYLMTFTSQIYSYILLPTIGKIISSLSAFMDEEKYFYSWPNRDIIFLLSSWDIAFSFERLHWFELGAIRFPGIFFNSNTWYWDEKKAKLTNFIELAILEFWCPKRTHNTKSTLLPLEYLCLFSHLIGFIFLISARLTLKLW